MRESVDRANRACIPWLALLGLLQAGCSALGVETALGVAARVHGEILLRDRAGAETTLRPAACLSGDRANFRGVDLIAPPLILRVAAEPLDGLGVAVIDAESGERRGVFRRSSCTTMRGDVQRTGWRIDDVADVSGFVEVDCRLAGGEELAGSLTFEHCH